MFLELGNISKALDKVYNNKNILMILPYPSNKKNSKWWINKRLEKLYAIAALPLFLEKKKSPSLVIVSKYKPIIEKDSILLYISQYLLKDKSITLETRVDKHYLYRSDNIIKYKNLRLFGIIAKNYEI